MEPEDMTKEELVAEVRYLRARADQLAEQLDEARGHGANKPHT